MIDRLIRVIMKIEQFEYWVYALCIPPAIIYYFRFLSWVAMCTS